MSKLFWILQSIWMTITCSLNGHPLEPGSPGSFTRCYCGKRSEWVK